MEQMVIEDYDKPLRSPVSRSSSSTSLKDQLSPDLIIHDIKLYPRMSRAGAVPRQSRQRSHRSHCADQRRDADAPTTYVQHTHTHTL